MPYGICRFISPKTSNCWPEYASNTASTNRISLGLFDNPKSVWAVIVSEFVFDDACDAEIAQFAFNNIWYQAC